MKNWRITVCIVFLLMVSVVFSQNTWPETRLQQVKNDQGEIFRQNVRSIYDSLKYVSDYPYKMKVADTLFAITLVKDELAHFHSLLYRAMHSGKNETELFDQAYKIADKYHRIDDINNVEHSRARFYLAKKQYDSAMVYLLRYRDRTPPDLKGEGYRNIVNLLGDIYFNAGLYSRAREVYSSLLKLYEDDDNWNYYRPYVMMNNLGQIAFKTGNLKLAREWYHRSLELAEKHLYTSYRNNTVFYTKTKLAEVAIGQDSLEIAGQLLNEISDYPESSIYADVRQEYLYARALLFLWLGKPDEAEVLANELQPGDPKRFGEYRFVPEIYRLLADIHTVKKDYYQALQYNNRYQLIEDSLKAQEHLAASMIIFADYNHELTRLELQRSKQRIIIMTIGLIAVVSVLFITLILNRKLYRSKLELVRKSMEKGQPIELQVAENGNAKKNEVVNDIEKQKQKELISDLKVMMEKHKSFLDPGVTIVEVARQLNTNRTYLSRAINNLLETTFPNFINEYRIRESIRLIISGYTQNLTQEALSRQSGFANRNVFISALKKYTGVLPSFFIANYKKWDQNKNRFVDNE